MVLVLSAQKTKEAEMKIAKIKGAYSGQKFISADRNIEFAYKTAFRQASMSLGIDDVSLFSGSGRKKTVNT